MKFCRIYPIKLFKDNYSYLVINKMSQNLGFLIDPAQPDVIINYLK